MRITPTIIASAFVLGAAFVSTPAASAQVTRAATITGPQGKSATVVRSIDADRSDGRVGVQRTVTGPDGRTASRSRSTRRDDGAIVHDASRTGFGGRTATREGVYTATGSSHTRTGRGGRTRSWSRSR